MRITADTRRFAEGLRRAQEEVDRMAKKKPDTKKKQIKRLAWYIMNNIPGEPILSEGACDTAIRIMREQKNRIAELEHRLAMMGM